jgi:hypothetical protein
MAQVLHLTGPVLVGREEERPEAWVVGGTLTFERPSGDHDVTTLDGWVLPGLVDAHCHIGLVATGATDAATAEEQALADRGAGTLLIRDAGSPSDTRWVDDRADLPKDHPGRAAHRPTLAATSATTRGRSSPRASSSRSGSRPGRATGGSSSSATGSTATPATSRRAGRSTSSPRRSRRPTRKGPGSPRTASSEAVPPRLRGRRHRLHRARDRAW